MALFGSKMTFFEAIEALDCEILSEHQKKKVIKAEAHFSDEEKRACDILISLHKGVQGVGTAVYLIDRASKDDICGKIMAALFTSLAFRTFSAAHESDPTDPDCIAYLALAYEYGFFGCKKDHAKALEAVQPLRSSDESGALVRKALKDILSAGGTSDGGNTASGASSSETSVNGASDGIGASKDKAAGSSGADSRQSGAISSTAASIALSGTLGAGAASGTGFSSASDKSTSDKSEPQGEFKRIEIDGDLFEGWFINGKKNGRGKYTWANGDVYDGMWKDGKRCGRGRISWSNGASFDGEWLDGMMVEGKYCFADGSVYEGGFKNGKYDGYGKRIYKDGDRYEGQWQSGSRYGNGVYIWADGDVYDGEWKDDKRCGVGRMVMYGKAGPDALNAGEIFIKYSYDGEWLDNREHGHGICREGNGSVAGMDKVYEGEWVNGRKCGLFVWHFLHRDGEIGKSYIDFYEDGRAIETCIPYDESIKTVEDGRRAKDSYYGSMPSNMSGGYASGRSGSQSVGLSDTRDSNSDRASDEWEEFSSISELQKKLVSPELFLDPRDRYIGNSSLYLRPFADELREALAESDYEESRELISGILGIDQDELAEWIDQLDFLHGFTDKEYILKAMRAAAYTENVKLAPYLANFAYFLFKDTGDPDYFDPLFDLFTVSCEYGDDDCVFLCAMLRLQESGNLNDPLIPDCDGNYDSCFGYYDGQLEDLLDKGYLPGSNAKMYQADDDGGYDDDNTHDDDEDTDESETLIEYENGDYYRGSVVDGLREGHGVYHFATGEQYTGGFHQNGYEGYGVLDAGNGVIYKGLWKDDKRCGYGEQTYKNGDVYRGWWKDNRYNGFGRYEYANGVVNIGEFVDGISHGIFLTKKNGSWCGQRWSNDSILPSPNGPRVIDCENGARYVGSVSERRVGNTTYISKSGFGEIRFANINSSELTDCYVGQFVNDAPCGTGVCITANSDNPYIIASDNFTSNCLPEGDCRMISLWFENGVEWAEYYIGEFHGSRRKGRGTLYLIGSKEGYMFRPYMLYSGSILRCDSFDLDPRGDVAVTDWQGSRSDIRM